jgi:predicted signal transduction protein with EAL and GGDEF domain
VRAVIGLARGLAIPVAAEGLETQAHEFLAAEKCDKVQGFLIGRPEPIEHYAKYVGRKTAVFADVIPLRQQQAAGARGRRAIAMTDATARAMRGACAPQTGLAPTSTAATMHGSLPRTLQE